MHSSTLASVFVLSTITLSITLPAAAQTAAPPLSRAAAASWGTAVTNADGSIVAWPEGATGEAVPVKLPRKAVQVAVHQYTAFALLDDGSVMGWGMHNFESLGVPSNVIPDRTVQAEPKSIPGLRDVAQMAATYGHAVAARRDGTVMAWGETVAMLRGEAPSASRRMAPVTAVPGLTGIVQVATGARHSLALSRDGHVFAWGENGRGELGSGQTGAERGVGPVTGLDGVVAIAAGGSTSVALKSDGTVWVWGWGQSGMIGNGQRPSTNEPGGAVSTPVIVKGVTNVRAIAAGEGHVMALLADGTIRAWGHNGYGQIGNGQAGGYQLLPIRVPSLTGIASIAAGGYRSFAIATDGRVWHWGTPIPVSPGKRPNQKVPVLLDGVSR